MICLAQSVYVVRLIRKPKTLLGQQPGDLYFLHKSINLNRVLIWRTPCSLVGEVIMGLSEQQQHEMTLNLCDFTTFSSV